MTPFDPYHKWLGIPPKEQPAGPHRLLGISEDENDPQVVREAALRQTAFVRPFSMGEHAEHADRILGELADARDSILCGMVESPTKSAVKATPSSAEFIATPLVNVTATAGRETPQAEPTPSEDPLSLITEELAAISATPSTRSGSRSGKPIWQQPWVMLTAAGVALMALLILFSSGGDRLRPAQKQQRTNTNMVDQEAAVQNDPRENNEDINKKMSWFQKRVDELEAELDEAYQKASVHQRQQSTKLNDRFAIVTVKNMHPVPLTTSILTSKTKIKCNDDNQLPQIFHKATTWVVKDGAPWQESNAWLRFRVEQSGRMYLIAHWQYEGNANRGGWQNQRISLPHLKQGWNLIGRASWDPEVYFFSRLVDVGEEYEMRTNKYWPPYLIADVAAAEEPSDKPMLLPSSKP
jgi:hypothetical protein